MAILPILTGKIAWVRRRIIRVGPERAAGGSGRVSGDVPPARRNPCDTVSHIPSRWLHHLGQQLLYLSDGHTLPAQRIPFIQFIT